MSRWTHATLITGFAAAAALAAVALVLGQDAVIALATVIGLLVIAVFYLTNA